MQKRLAGINVETLSSSRDSIKMVARDHSAPMTLPSCGWSESTLPCFVVISHPSPINDCYSAITAHYTTMSAQLSVDDDEISGVSLLQRGTRLSKFSMQTPSDSKLKLGSLVFSYVLGFSIETTSLFVTSRYAMPLHTWTKLLASHHPKIQTHASRNLS